MNAYLKLLRKVLDEGVLSINRTNFKAFSLFGAQLKFDLRKGFPLVTTKKVFFKGVIYELLWFIAGEHNIRYLCKHGVNIWNEWPYKKYQESTEYKQESINEFIFKIINSKTFAKKWGDLGPIYGKQWRNFAGVDQLKWLISEIKRNPSSRRLIINSWNVGELSKMILPPCHVLFQLHVEKNRYLSGHLYQRSADLFLGVPFNIASYSLLLTLIAKECNLEPKMLIHSFGNVHIYENHFDQVKKQLNRLPLALPTLKLNYSANSKNIFSVKYDDILLINYKSHNKLIGKIAV